MWGFITLVLSTIGTIFAFKKWVQFNKLDGEMANRLANVYMSDGLIYFITAMFGFTNAFQIEADELLYPVRAGFILLNILMAWKLIKPL